MKVLYRQIKYWFYVRKNHIEGIELESGGGVVSISVKVKGKRIKIAEVTRLEGICEEITDYGIAIDIEHAIRRG